ncbi:MAG TPA: PilZ domain-containing protein [Polyangiaceae bacterium]
MTVEHQEQPSPADLADMARTACGSLEPLLGALQSDSTVADSLRDLAAPLVDALVALVRIEASALQSPESPVDACPFELRSRARRVALQVHVVDLGLQSASNFYRGLSGHDVVDGGGLFVATYDLPDPGVPVRLRIRMAGGYQFEVNGVVRWRREPGKSLDDAPPGFGARITAIAPQARELVSRYVYNREPIFHDDA